MKDWLQNNKPLWLPVLVIIVSIIGMILFAPKQTPVNTTDTYPATWFADTSKK